MSTYGGFRSLTLSRGSRDLKIWDGFRTIFYSTFCEPENTRVRRRGGHRNVVRPEVRRDTSRLRLWTRQDDRVSGGGALHTRTTEQVGGRNITRIAPSPVSKRGELVVRGTLVSSTDSVGSGRSNVHVTVRVSFTSNLTMVHSFSSSGQVNV